MVSIILGLHVMVKKYGIQLPTPETRGETGSVHPKRSQKAALQHVKQKN